MSLLDYSQISNSTYQNVYVSTICVKNLTSTRNKINLDYINEYNYYLRNWFCDDKL